MSKFYEILGIDELMSTEKGVLDMMSYVSENGKVIPGYSKDVSIFYSAGNADLFVSAILDEENKRFEAEDFDTHFSNKIVWNVCIEGDITPKDFPKMHKRLIVSKAEDRSSIAVINALNADVLPSFIKGEVIQLQVCGFGLNIDFYENEEEFLDNVETGSNGEKYTIADGVLFPSGLLKGHNPDDIDENAYEYDDYMLFRGTIKALHFGSIEIDGKEIFREPKCIIDTTFGELEIHMDLASFGIETLRKIKVGDIISGIVVLSADAAIFDYEESFVKDEENNLKLMCNAIQNDSADRLWYILTEDSEYFAETIKPEENYQNRYIGREEIINRLNHIAENSSDDRYAYTGTIISIDGDEELQHKVGERCIVIAREKEDRFVCIMFLTLDDEGNILKIHTSDDSRYHFQLDQVLETTDDLFDDYEE